MTMSMKDLCAHVASLDHLDASGEALVSGIAEMVAGLGTRTEVGNAAQDLRANAKALAAAVLWGTPLQGNMARPEPVEPPWVPAAEPAADPAAEPGAHLAVELDADAPAPDAADEGTDEAGEEAVAEDAEDDNGPVERQPRGKPHPKGRGRR